MPSSASKNYKRESLVVVGLKQLRTVNIFTVYFIRFIITVTISITLLEEVDTAPIMTGKLHARLAHGQDQGYVWQLLGGILRALPPPMPQANRIHLRVQCCKL